MSPNINYTSYTLLERLKNSKHVPTVWRTMLPSIEAEEVTPSELGNQMPCVTTCIGQFFLFTKAKTFKKDLPPRETGTASCEKGENFSGKRHCNLSERWAVCGFQAHLPENHLSSGYVCTSIMSKLVRWAKLQISASSLAKHGIAA